MPFIGKTQINIGDKVNILGKEYIIGSKVEIERDYSSLKNLGGKMSYISKTPHPNMVGYFLGVIPAKEYSPMLRSEDLFLVMYNFDPSISKNIPVRYTYGEYLKYISKINVLKSE
ncbi:MAG: hypothetical protein KatS3mg002_1406 [Candidatus Woesearchaeota archaeon]|nr:MAG: hypothetical protein KatS3mg002_1406 [Candidatus Woesearchaeota archaeon]